MFASDSEDQAIPMVSIRRGQSPSIVARLLGCPWWSRGSTVDCARRRRAQLSPPCPMCSIGVSLAEQGDHCYLFGGRV